MGKVADHCPVMEGESKVVSVGYRCQQYTTAVATIEWVVCFVSE